MIRSLVKQIGGTIEIESEAGVEVRIVFADASRLTPAAETGTTSPPTP
jgi:two-component sensor histidine kinase